jgi:preprotein translocase subunit SecE
VAEKTVKAKQVEGAAQAEKPRQPEKAKPVQKVTKPADKDKDREKPKQPSAIARWYRETIGELRKVSWPTTHDTWRLTQIVLVVMFVMSALLGILDYFFSRLIAMLVI